MGTLDFRGDNGHAVDVKAKMPNSDETYEGGRDDATVVSDAVTQATIAWTDPDHSRITPDAATE